MAKPLVVVVPHQLGLAEARRRLETGLTSLAQTFGDKLTSVDQRWTGDRLDVNVKALGQSVAAGLDISETEVRVEVQLPWMLAMIAEKAKGYIQKEGQLLLGRK